MTKHPVKFEKKFNRKVTNKKQEILYKFWMTGVVIGFFAGTGSFMAAILLTIYDFLSSDAPGGSRLFLAVLPLWVFGAHSLDKAEEAESRYP